MSKPKTIFEHELYLYDWTLRELGQLERLNQAYGAEILKATTHHGNRALQGAEFAGVVRLGAQTFQILPKLYASQAPLVPTQEATRNLLHMLAYASDLPIHDYSLVGLFSRNTDWFEILTKLFVSHLQAEWLRGAQRNYERVDDTLPLLKGKWRIGEQLRRPERHHQFSVSYDEFTSDTALNRVFRFVVERLWHLTRDVYNRRSLGEMRQWMDEVTLVPALSAEAAPPTLITRLNERFAPLLNLARLFLTQRSVQLMAHDTETFAFVLDMNALFERFVANFIRRHRDEIFPNSPNMLLLVQTSGVAKYLAHNEDGKRVFLLKPDLAIRDGDSFPLLIDTKYKTLESDKNNLGINREDFYQMFAYARRYECPRVILLYPQTADSPSIHRTFRLETIEAEIRVATLDLRIDLSKGTNRSSLMNELKTALLESNDANL